jgi:tRNA modification GTPase
MKEYILDDTIGAISTPPGHGAIAIIRMSGAKSFEIAKDVFISGEKFEKLASWQAVFGKIYDGKEEIDEVILIKFKSPNSYTKENMVEINCHGGSYISRRILELLLDKGARLASPGEFTLRAFLNGRMDLSRAEAVSDLIQAQTELSLQAALNQLDGKLSRRIKEIRDEIVDSTSLLELELDFSEEDLEFVNKQELIEKIQKINEEISELISTFRVGRIAREGVKMVITGKPNVGKSSLLNRLLKEERAIVTDVPGTTRDALEVHLDITGVLFRVVDTAGLIHTDDPVEKEGVRRAEQHLRTADIIIHLFDGSGGLDENDRKIMDKIENLSGANVVRVVNKADREQILNISGLCQNSGSILSISALVGSGIKQLEKRLYKIVFSNGDNIQQQAMITNVRHYDSLKKARANLTHVVDEINKGASSEFIAVYLRDAIDNLGQIVGDVSSEDVLNNIFSKFCIGK